MKHAPRVRLEPRPSRFAGAFILIACFASTALVALLAIPWWAKAIALGAAVGIGVREFWRCAGGGCPALVCVGDDRRVTVVNREGRGREGEILDASYVGAMLATIVWRVDPAAWWRPARTILILRDMLPAEDFRRLRVLLRYGVPEPPPDRPPETSGVDAR